MLTSKHVIAPKRLEWVDELLKTVANKCFINVYDLGDDIDDTFAENTNFNIDIFTHALRNAGVPHLHDVMDHGFSQAFACINSRLTFNRLDPPSQDHIFRVRIAALYVFEKVLAKHRLTEEIDLVMRNIKASLHSQHEAIMSRNPYE